MSCCKVHGPPLTDPTFTTNVRPGTPECLRNKIYIIEDSDDDDDGGVILISDDENPFDLAADTELDVVEID